MQLPHKSPPIARLMPQVYNSTREQNNNAHCISSGVQLHLDRCPPRARSPPATTALGRSILDLASHTVGALGARASALYGSTRRFESSLAMNLNLHCFSETCLIPTVFFWNAINRFLPRPIFRESARFDNFDLGDCAYETCGWFSVRWEVSIEISE
jgi:hypothetical protein